MQVLLGVRMIHFLEALFEYCLDDVVWCPFLRRRDKPSFVCMREKGLQKHECLYLLSPEICLS